MTGPSCSCLWHSSSSRVSCWHCLAQVTTIPPIVSMGTGGGVGSSFPENPPRASLSKSFGYGESLFPSAYPGQCAWTLSLLSLSLSPQPPTPHSQRESRFVWFQPSGSEYPIPGILLCLCTFGVLGSWYILCSREPLFPLC